MVQSEGLPDLSEPADTARAVEEVARAAWRSSRRGELPTMNACAVCGRPGACFRLAHGALLCDTCTDGANHGHL